MKKSFQLLLIILLAISLIGNVVLVIKLIGKNEHSELDNKYDTSNNSVPTELIGVWEAEAGRKVEVFDDGVVYWTYNTSDGVYEGYIGRVDGYSFILSQEYDFWNDEDLQSRGTYKSMSEVPEEKLVNAHIIYNITMYGNDAFSAQAVNNDYTWTFIKNV